MLDSSLLASLLRGFSGVRPRGTKACRLPTTHLKVSKKNLLSSAAASALRNACAPASCREHRRRA